MQDISVKLFLEKQKERERFLEPSLYCRQAPYTDTV
jgi:hypothetical protein